VPSLLIRNVDQALHARLKEHAAAHSRSLEEEARELLRAGLARQAATPRENLVDIARRLFGPKHGAELDIPPRGSAPGRKPPDFSSPDFDR
jgi:plasmid stability protein